MTLAERIANFFMVVHETWEAVPSYVKVFLYSTVSSTVGLYLTDSLTVDSVIVIVVSNLGLYSLPKGANIISKNLR